LGLEWIPSSAPAAFEPKPPLNPVAPALLPVLSWDRLLLALSIEGKQSANSNTVPVDRLRTASEGRPNARATAKVKLEMSACRHFSNSFARQPHFKFQYGT
jgi:hypothetical protein